MKRPAMYLPVALTLLTALTVANAADAQAAGWRTDGTGAYPNTKAPSEWSTDQNVVWRCALPSWSNATPVVLDDRVICCSEPATVIAVDKANGKILWQTPVTYKDAGVDDRPSGPGRTATTVTRRTRPSSMATACSCFSARGCWRPWT